MNFEEHSSTNNNLYNTGNPYNQLDSNPIIRRVIRLLLKGRGWIKFLGIVEILFGISTFFSRSSDSVDLSINILSGLFQVVLGFLLLQASASIKNASLTPNINDVENTFKSIGRYFMINGILLLLFCCIFVLLLISAIGLSSI